MTATATKPAPPARNARGAGGPRRNREMWVLMLPALVPVLLFSVGPLLYGIGLAFTDAESGKNHVTGFVGLENFGDLLADDTFWASMRVGLIWAVTVTVLQFLASLGLALLLNQKLWLTGLARVLTVVPWAMPPVVIGLMWRLVYHPDAGIVNSTLGTDINWLADFTWALPAVIVMGVWSGMPQTTIVLLAGLQTIPKELYEAGEMDGAGTWRKFWSITLPQLRPIIVTITSLDFVWNVNQFSLVYVLTQGGPGGQTRLPMLFAYEEAFRYGFFGYAATLGVSIVIVVLALLGVYLWRQTEGGVMRRIPQYVALLAYMVFLAFPLVWLLSTALKTPQEMASLRPDVDPAPSPTLANFADAFGEQDLVGAGAQPGRGAGERAAHGHRGAARLLRAGPLPGRAQAGRARLGAGQPGVPVHPDHHPAVHGAAAARPGQHAVRPRGRACDLHAAVRAVDAPGVRAVGAARAGGGRGGGRRRPACGRSSASSRRCSRPAWWRPLLFSFISSWNEFLFALVVLKDPDVMTLPLTLVKFTGAEGVVQARPAGRGVADGDDPEPDLFRNHPATAEVWPDGRRCEGLGGSHAYQIRVGGGGRRRPGRRVRRRRATAAPRLRP